MNEKELYINAVNLWGKQSQVLMAIEEMGELLQALSKIQRKENGCDWDHVIQEIADVEIMMEELKVVFCVSDEKFKEVKKAKLLKLENAIKMGLQNENKKL